MQNKLTIFYVIIACCITNCNVDRSEQSQDKEKALMVLRHWNTLILELERATIGYRAPVSARMFAYVEMVAYETSVPYLENYISLDNQYEAYNAPPRPVENGYLPQSLNAAMARILRHFFRTAPRQFISDIDVLEKKYTALLSKDIGAKDMTPSIQYGQVVADSIWAFSKKDIVGHDAFLNNYDQSYNIQDAPDKWKPNPQHPLPPLLPFWGKVRPFLIEPSSYKATKNFTFDSIAGSPFYNMGMELLSTSRSYTKEQIWVAEFWSDDFPQLTVTSAGRWISIANQAIELDNATYEKAIETYLKVSIALCDASIVCWQNKYLYQSVRPETYIRQHLDPKWNPLHDAPNFPSFPSGHSMFGAACAEVLTALYGDHFIMTDRTHEGREEFLGNPRTFHSFKEMCKENAYSRILIGVHFRVDCTEGLKLGTAIGRKVAALNLKPKTALSYKNR